MDVPKKERYVRSYPMVKGSAQKKEVQARTIMARPDILADLPAPSLTLAYARKDPCLRIWSAVLCHSLLSFSAFRSVDHGQRGERQSSRYAPGFLPRSVNLTTCPHEGKLSL